MAYARQRFADACVFAMCHFVGRERGLGVRLKNVYPTALSIPRI